jgi:hypothetical protein
MNVTLDPEVIRLQAYRGNSWLPFRLPWHEDSDVQEEQTKPQI